MARSETGANANAMSSGNLGMHNETAAAPQPIHMAYSAADGTAVYRVVHGSSGAYPSGNGSMRIQPKKRGRPRKYASDVPAPVIPVSSAPPAFSPPSPQPPPPAPQAASRSKKARGRPPGAGSRGKPQIPALGDLASPVPIVSRQGSPVTGFTPHAITVQLGEDVASKIMSFCQNGPRAICILSANGALSNVTLRQAATSAGLVTYEGYFEILSLSGSFMLSDGGGHCNRTGALSVSLAGPDGRVLGGGVAGLLIAASPVQVIVGSFLTDGRKDSSDANQKEPMSAPPRFHSGIGAAVPSSPPSHGTQSESSGGAGSPLNQTTVALNNAPSSVPGHAWK